MISGVLLALPLVWLAGDVALAGYLTTDSEVKEIAPEPGRFGHHAGYLFWTDGGDIFRSDLDGGNVLQVYAGSETGGRARHVDVDPVEGKLYSYGSIGARSDGTGYVRRSNLDGSEAENVLTGLPSPVRGFAVDPMTRAMYLGGSGDDPQTGLRRANLDGTGLTLLPPMPSNPADIAVDWQGGHVYFSDRRDRGVKRFSPEEEDITALVGRDDGDSGSMHLAVDPNKSTLYYTRGAAGDLMRVGLDGSGSAVVLAGLGGVRDVDFDPKANGLYVATESGIHRAGPGGMIDEPLVRFDAPASASGLGAAFSAPGESLAVLPASGGGLGSVAGPAASRSPRDGASAGPVPAGGDQSAGGAGGGGGGGGAGSNPPRGGGGGAPPAGLPPMVGPPPVSPSPFDPSPFDPSPFDPSPFDPSPFDPSPFDPSPFNPSPVTPPPVNLPPVIPPPGGPPPVPEPSSLALIGTGLFGAGGAMLLRRRNKMKASARSLDDAVELL